LHLCISASLHPCLSAYLHLCISPSLLLCFSTSRACQQGPFLSCPCHHRKEASTICIDKIDGLLS
jgi:hypothetical protein